MNQEPIARVTGTYGGRFVVEPLNPAMVLPSNMALYTHPQPKREWVGLTEEEISDATKDIRGIHCVIVDEIARAIEAKLKEKNT